MNSPSTVSAASGSTECRPLHRPSPGAADADRLQSHAQASTSGSPPQSIFYNYPVTGGSSPQARWAHAATSIGSLIYVYGGVASSVMDDLWMLDTDVMVWRPLVPSANRPKDRPEKMHAAAMCATGHTLWLFGGQQGRSHLRTLYALDTEALSWRLCNPTGANPPGRAGHSFTAVAGQGVYLFGGQGKKLYNDMYVLQGDGTAWLDLKPRGQVPPPRSGHSMVWDEQERLVCFGGMVGNSTDNTVYVYSISSNQWSKPTVTGTVPSSRTQHTAVLLPGNTHMLVFGGCNAQGTFFNDAYVLDINTFTWTRPQQLNIPPPPRYHHCCFCVDSKVLIYGGINATQAFEGVVVLESNFGSELSAVADELFKMSAAATTSGPAAAGPSRAPAAGAGGGAGAGGPGMHPLVSDLMKLQLRDLLVKRNMEEMRVSAGHKAEQHGTRIQQLTAEKTALEKELLQARLVVSETEDTVQQLKQQLKEVSKALAQEQAEAERLRGSLREAHSVSSAQRVQLAEARQLLEGMSCELGIVSSRYHRTLQENTALRGARRRRALRERSQQQQQGHGRRQGQQQQQQQQQEMPEHELPQTPSGAEGAAQRLVLGTGDMDATDVDVAATAHATTASSRSISSSGEGVSGGSGGSDPDEGYDTAEENLEMMLWLTGTSSTAAAAAADGGASSPGYPQQHPLVPSLTLPGAAAGSAAQSRDFQAGSCVHGQQHASCLACMCDRYLAHTAEDGSAVTPLQVAAADTGSSSTAPGVPQQQKQQWQETQFLQQQQQQQQQQPLELVAEQQVGPPRLPYQQLLSQAERQRGALQEEVAALQVQLQSARQELAAKDQKLALLQGQGGVLASCSVPELQQLEVLLEASAKSVRAAMLQRTIEQQHKASVDSQLCGACHAAARGMVLGCGHQTCTSCGERAQACPFCGAAVGTRIRLSTS